MGTMESVQIMLLQLKIQCKVVTGLAPTGKFQYLLPFKYQVRCLFCMYIQKGIDDIYIYWNCGV